MPMVFKKVTLVGTSTESFEQAVDDALGRARATLENIHWMEVESMGVEVASVDQPEYQAEVKVAFQVEEEV